MIIISWNINGWRAMMKKPYLLKLIGEYNPDILCFQEIKINKDVKIELEGYNCEYHIGEKPGYSGTAIFYKQSINPLKIKRNKTEGRLMSIEFEEFILVNVYVPNSGEKVKRLDYRVNTWDKNFTQAMKNLQKTNNSNVKPLVIVGDMNVARTINDIKNAKQNEKNAGYTIEERESFEKILKNVDLIDVWRDRNPTINNKYSYWSYKGVNARKHNVGWRIDYVLMSKSIKEKECEILDNVYGSDHAPILLKL